MDNLVLGLVIEQRKRLIASILGAAETSSWYKTLTPQQQKEYRQRVLDSIGVFYDFIRDVIKVTNDGWMISDEAMNMISAIHASQRNLEIRLRGADGQLQP